MTTLFSHHQERRALIPRLSEGLSSENDATLQDPDLRLYSTEVKGDSFLLQRVQCALVPKWLLCAVVLTVGSTGLLPLPHLFVYLFIYSFSRK